MKPIITLLLLFFLIVGCNENINQPQDNSIFEKRTPVTNRDSVKNRVPLQRALECLNLTRQQRIVIDSLLREDKICSMECKKEFNDQIKTLREEYRSKLEKYRGVEKTDEIKKEIQIINFEFRQTQKDLGKEYRKKMELCRQNLFTSIESVLFNASVATRPDQLTLWNIWKATGKIPCEKRP